ELNYEDVRGLYAGLGEGIISLPKVLRRIEKILVPKERKEREPDTVAIPTIPPPSRPTDSAIIVPGAGDVMAKLSRCCQRLPPGNIIGLVARGSVISGHRNEWRSVVNTPEPDRLIEVEWAPTSESSFTVDIVVLALDRKQLLSDLTAVLAEHHVNILSANVN